MTDRRPTVSMGLPVYNGQRYLAQAVESLLAQTFGDFELVLCDNASTDETESIGRDLEKRDRRVRYHRNERNLGAAPNFNRAWSLCAGRVVFKWAATTTGTHDVMRSVSRCGETVRGGVPQPDRI